jgi:cytochrome c553
MRSPRLILAAALAAAAFGAHAQAPAAHAAAAPAAAPAAPAAAPAAPAAAAPAPVKGNADAGKNKVYQCQGCHGIPDWKTAFPEVYRVPKLGGQKEAYIVAALKAYRSGERDFATMRGMAMDMSDQDMADIAA